MRCFQLERFGVDGLSLHDVPPPEPGPGEIRLGIRARSLNFRDLLVVRGHYNKKLRLPAVPLSDASGVIEAVGDNVHDWAVGDEVMGHFVADWVDGPYRGEYLATTLGTPGAGMAADAVLLPAQALVRKPAHLDFEQAATLPIAALTAWSALVTEGGLRPGASDKTVLTLGTGGVSLFAVQIAKALGATVVVTSSSDQKLDRARALGADHGINYRSHEDWDRKVLQCCGGADVVVENGGARTLTRSLRATRPGGVVGMLGALTGLEAPIDLSGVLMKRIRIAGILVDCRRAFEQMCEFLSEHRLEPVIDQRFTLEQLPQALAALEAGAFGKIVVA